MRIDLLYMGNNFEKLNIYFKINVLTSSMGSREESQCLFGEEKWIENVD